MLSWLEQLSKPSDVHQHQQQCQECSQGPLLDVTHLPGVILDAEGHNAVRVENKKQLKTQKTIEIIVKGNRNPICHHCPLSFNYKI